MNCLIPNIRKVKEICEYNKYLSPDTILQTYIYTRAQRHTYTQWFKYWSIVNPDTYHWIYSVKYLFSFSTQNNCLIFIYDTNRSGFLCVCKIVRSWISCRYFSRKDSSEGISTAEIISYASAMIRYMRHSLVKKISVFMFPEYIP